MSNDSSKHQLPKRGLTQYIGLIKLVLSYVLVAGVVIATGMAFSFSTHNDVWFELSIFIVLVLAVVWKTLASLLKASASQKSPALLPQPYGPVAAVLFTIGIYLAAQIIAGIVIAIVPLIQGWEEARVANWLENNPLAVSSYMAIVALASLAMLMALLKRRGGDFRALGLNAPRLKYIGYALSGFAAYFVLYVLVSALIKALVPGYNPDQEQDIGFKAGIKGLALILAFVCLVILPPLVEEIVMRGFLYGGLRTKLSITRATLITSFIFGMAHLGGGTEGLLWVAAVDTFILSIILCYLREKTGSLWPSIGVHMIKNALAFTILFVVTR